MAEGREVAVLRWLPTHVLDGPRQMALDAWLLKRAVEGDRLGPVLRFYRWSRPTLSLGKHQGTLLPHWRRLVEDGQLAMARRPTGGSAVLHGGDLTYALIWPDPPRRRREAYRLCCRWLQEAFADLGQPLTFGDSPCLANQANCFASSTAADLVHANGQKRVGSAQLWRGGCLLQHGSVLLEPDARLWGEVFGESPPDLLPLPLVGEALEAHLLAAAQRWLPLPGSHAGDGHVGGTMEVRRVEGIGAAEWETIQAEACHYDVEETADPAAALSAMDWATDSKGSPGG
ncbi:MAG: biotin/lipoate A/B protein ligase family protein [Cyanobacteriota bacterium]